MEYHPEISKPASIVKIIFTGAQDSATLQSLTACGAQVSLLNNRPVWIGRFLALQIGDMPAIPADIRDIDNLSLTLVFRSELHPSVFQHYCHLLEQAQSANKPG